MASLTPSERTADTSSPEPLTHRPAASFFRRMTGQFLCRLSRRALLVCALIVGPGSLLAQEPTPTGSGAPTGDLQLPVLPPGVTPQQALEYVRSRPDLAAQIRDRIRASGLTPDQVRSRLRALNYPESLLDEYLVGADTVGTASPGGRELDALRSLGVTSRADSDSLLALTDSALAARDSLRADSLRTDSRALRVFGLDLFRRSSTQFQPLIEGPVDDRYRLGAGDGLVLILSGDVEATRTLDINRDGFVVIPQVGQLLVANLTMAQLRQLLTDRLGRVYSGIRRDNTGSTRFEITVSRLRNVQVFVVGDVARPGAYQMSAAGTVLSALYAAGGPTERGTFRRITVRRGADAIGTLDLYDYLLRGNAGSDLRLQSGDVVFVPPRVGQVKVTGAVLRPAIYEPGAEESIASLIATAGGFGADADQSRVQIHRIQPPAARQNGADRVVIDVAAGPLGTVDGSAFLIEAGDSVVIYPVRSRVRNVVSVKGSVWTEGVFGYSRGMRVSDAIRLAGGPRPDVYLGAILVSRLQRDSTRIQLRTAFADTTGRVTDDLLLDDDDLVEVFSRNTFRPERFVIVTGAVREPGRVEFRDGMTLRDALLAVEGVTEDALLTEAEISRLPDDRRPGELARTSRVALDSTYLFERSPDGRYLGPPGLPARAAGADEVVLRPYDNVLILRQPEWELQRPVAIVGQVKYPGKYSLRSRTDRLSDLLERAGGLTAEAYPTGIEFYRNAGRLGRIGVDLPKVLKEPRFRDNLILASGDSIVIPEFNPVVRVAGAVNAPVAVAYVPGRTLQYYVSAAGGTARLADRGRTYVTQPSGKVESGLRRKALPGATIFVPEKDPADRNAFLQTIGTIGPLVGSLATVIIFALSQ